MPVDPLIGHCDKVIGMHCNPVDKEYDTGNMKALLERTFLLTINGNVENRKRNCDLFLEPYDLRKYGAFDFAKSREIFDKGYEYALKNEGKIKAIGKG